MLYLFTALLQCTHSYFFPMTSMRRNFPNNFLSLVENYFHRHFYLKKKESSMSVLECTKVVWRWIMIKWSRWIEPIWNIYERIYGFNIAQKNNPTSFITSNAARFVCSFVGVCMLFRNVNQFHVQQRTTKIVILIWAN